jgi:hypothetical protein
VSAPRFLLCALGVAAQSAPTPASAPRPTPVVAAAPAPSIEDFVALASKDEKVHEAAATRLSPVWRDGYAALVIDLARFFRPQRATPGGGPADDALGEIDSQTGAAPPARGREVAFSAPRSPESLIRARLLRFLSARTKKSFGSDLRPWRRWMWSLPYEPHPDYAAFKAKLYANVDPRMARFFESPAPPRIRLDEIDWGGVPVNGIPPLENPSVVSAASAKFMGDRNVVFGVVVNGVARAYPKRILAWHEMALDTVGGVRLAIVYCTLCGTVIPYEAEVSGRAFTFGTSGLLYRSNKLMFDRETMSLWSTLEGRPVVGPLAGSDLALRYRPVVTTTWKEWRAAHPDTTVLSLDTGHDRDYDEGVAYRDYFAHDDLMFEVPEQDKRLKRKAEVVTFFAGDDRRPVPVALDVAFLRKNPLHSFEAGGVAYVVHTTEAGANRIYRRGGVKFVRAAERALFDSEDRAWTVAEDALRLQTAAGVSDPAAPALPREPARRTFWFAWFAQFKETVLVR